MASLIQDKEDYSYICFSCGEGAFTNNRLAPVRRAGVAGSSDLGWTNQICFHSRGPCAIVLSSALAICCFHLRAKIKAFLWQKCGCRSMQEMEIQFVLASFLQVKCLRFGFGFPSGFFFWWTDFMKGAGGIYCLQSVPACLPMVKTTPWQAPSQTLHVIKLKVFPAHMVVKHLGMKKHWGWKMSCS